MAKLNYRPEIDGLRAIAVLAVVLYHAGFSWASGGYVGVDVFFVISGYLITGIILEEKEAKRFSLVGFYERRIRRILPALFAMMFCCLPFAWLLMAPSTLKDFFQSVAAVAVFGSNVLFWIESGYFERVAEEKPLLHTWSLAVEEQFYVVFPMFLAALWFVGIGGIRLILICVTIASLALAVWISHGNPEAAFFLAPTRAWQILVGAILAVTSIPIFCSYYSQALGIAGIVLVAWSALFLDNSSSFPGSLHMAAVCGTALVVAFGRPGTVVNRMLSWSPLVAIGLMSYSVYLWHQPIFAFFKFGSQYPTNTLLLGILTTLPLVIGWLSWRYIETPFRDRSKLSRRYVFALATVGSCVLFSIGVLGHLLDLKSLSLSESATAILDSAQPSPKRAECHTDGPDYKHPRDACEYFNGDLTWAVFGDSQTVEVGYALAKRLADSNEKLLHLSFSGCAPTLLLSPDSGYGHCVTWTREAIHELIRRKTINDVVIAYEFYTHFRDEIPSETKGKLWRSFTATLSALAESKRRVYVLLSVPRLPQDIETVVYQHDRLGALLGQTDALTVGSLADYRARNNYLFTKLRDEKLPKNVILIDPSDVLCPQGHCQVVRNGKALYFDDSHLSLYGAGLVASEILKEHPALSRSMGVSR